MSLELPVRDFFAHPTIAAMARHLDPTSVDKHESDTAIRAHRAQLPIVESGYFESGGAQLYSVHYRPRIDPTGYGVVLCHSIGHEYTRGYRNLQQLAVQLCKLGHEVLRFDYASTGNSEGKCDALTVASMRQNILDARSFLACRANVERISLVGLRVGATVAASIEASVFDRLVLWDPVFRGDDFVDLLDRLHAHALTSLTRFSRVRESDAIDQSYGHAMTTEKRESLKSLRLESIAGDPHRCSYVLTDTFARDGVADAWLARQRDVYRSSDRCEWDDARYTESAFSSPDCFRAIIDKIQGSGACK